MDHKFKIPSVNLFSLNPFTVKREISNPIPLFLKSLKKFNGFLIVKIPFSSKKTYLTDKPNVIRHVLQKNNRNYTKSKLVQESVAPQIGNGLLTSEGEYWLKQRRAIQPAFHRGKLEYISQVMSDEIKVFMDEVLEKHVHSGESFQIDTEMMHLAFKLVSKSLFGKDPEDDKLDLIGEVVSYGQQYQTKRIRMPFLKPWLYITGQTSKNEKMKKLGQDLLMEIISLRQESSEKKDDLLQMLIDTEYEDGTKMTNQQLLDESLIIYVAGHETTAIAMAWAIYLIATHPNVESKLVQSIAEDLKGEEPSFSNLRKLSYTTQVIEEAMRLYPPAWLVDREAINDDEIDGIKIKKGIPISCLIYSMHRHSDFWNKPNEFDPDRFSIENKKNHTPFSYIPFGGGPRLCIGNNFAMMEMQLIIAMIFQKYTFELITEKDSIDMQPMITLRPKNGILVKIQKR
ncbi:MAG: cytochrome P450 [Crocinitomicaceae bacterium]|nr:cytochrome P450 [Crocinitomicaceae bacterium]